VCVGDDPYLISGRILDSIPFSFFQPSVMMAIRCPPANTAVGSRKRLRSSYMISKTTAPSSVIVYILALSGLASAYMDHRHREVGGDILPLIGRGTGALTRGQLRDSDTSRKEIRNKWQRKVEDKSAWDIGVDGGHWDEWKDNPIKNRDEEEDGGGGFDDRQGDASTTEPTIYPTSEPTEEPTESVGNEVEPIREETPEPSREPTSKPRWEPKPEPSREPTKKPQRTPEPTRSPVATSRCTPCTDEPSPWMTKPTSEGGGGGKQCQTWPYVWNNNCDNGIDFWMRNRFCAQTCFEKGKPYPGDNCCPRQPTPNPTRSITEEPSPSPTKKPQPQPTPKPSPLPTKKPQPQPTPKPSYMPTRKPHPQPTSHPTENPTVHPSPEGDFEDNNNVLVFSGQCYWKNCGRCAGDCDNDSECSGNLVCFQRRGNTQAVPGCIGTTKSDVDYCIDKNDIPHGAPTPTKDPTPVPPSRSTPYPVSSPDDPLDVVLTPRPSRKPTPRPSAPTGRTKLTVLVEPGDDVTVRLGRCEGDCSSSDDCLDGLKCYKRFDGRLKNVPGCQGEGEAKTDYCISPDDVVPTPRPTRKPTPRPTMPTGSNKLTKVGNNLGEGMLGRCEGDCDNDRDCFPGLECMKRTDGRLKNGDVPGCKNEGSLGTDYCYDPNDIPPTPRPTRKPTKRPTRPPTVPDSIFITSEPVPTRSPSQGFVSPTKIPNLSGEGVSSPTASPLYPRSTPSPTGGRTSTGDSFDGDATATASFSPTPEPSTLSILDDDEIWITFSPFLLDLTLPTTVSGRSRSLLKQIDAGGYGRKLIEKSELQRIVGTVLDNKFREYWPNFRGLLIGSTLKDEIDLDRAQIVSYEFTGSALFLRDERFPPPNPDEMEGTIMEALGQHAAPLLFAFRRSEDNELQSVQELSLSWSDGGDFSVPSQVTKDEGNETGGRKTGAAVAAGIAAFICTALIGAALLIYSWRRGKGPFSPPDELSSIRSESQQYQEPEKYGENAPPTGWAGTMATPRLGIARAVRIMSPAKTSSPEMSTPARSSDGEGPPCFGEISAEVSDIAPVVEGSLRSDDMGRSDSEWSVNDVAAFHVDFAANIENTVPEVPAYPLECSHSFNESGTLGTMSALGDVHASSVLQIDDEVASQTTGSGRPSFFDLWQKNPSRRNNAPKTGFGSTTPPSSGVEDQVLGISLEETRLAMENNGMVAPAYRDDGSGDQVLSSTSYHGSSISSNFDDAGSSSQHSEGIRDYDRGYSLQSQLSGIDEVHSAEQSSSLAPGETLQLSACLPEMGNRDEDSSVSSIAG